MGDLRTHDDQVRNKGEKQPSLRCFRGYVRMEMFMVSILTGNFFIRSPWWPMRISQLILGEGAELYA